MNKVVTTNKPSCLCLEMLNFIFVLLDQPRGLVVRVSDYNHEVRVRFPVLPWEFFLVGEDPHGDHGLGS